MIDILGVVKGDIKSMESCAIKKDYSANKKELMNI